MPSPAPDGSSQSLRKPGGAASARCSRSPGPSQGRNPAGRCSTQSRERPCQSCPFDDATRFFCFREPGGPPMHKTILTLSLAALLACAHEEAAQPSAERDWEKGLDGNRGPQIAPLGPIDSDQSAYNYIRRREQERDLGSRMTAAGLDEIIAASSQVLASAMALPLFRAGVYLGSPRLIERACTSAKRVTHSALRTSGNVDAVLQGCGALTAARQGSSDACGEGKQKLRDAYALLSAEKPQEAARAAAGAARSLRGRCPELAAPPGAALRPGPC